MSRPEKPVDWKKVDDLLIAGCHGTEIAAHFDMHPQSFYNKIQAQYNLGFTEYSLEKKQKGDSILRAKQYETALKGNVPMQIWLGKNRLGQKDREEEKSKEMDVNDFLRGIKALLDNSRSESNCQPGVETKQSISHSEPERKFD